MIPRNLNRQIGALLIAALSAGSAFGCLNPIGQGYISESISLDGVSGPEVVRRLNTHKDRAYWEDVLNQILDAKRNQRKDPASYEYGLNNHAVALAHLGKVKEAIAILEELERKYPGEYATAANLGTVYELNGENEKALRWIKEGFRRDSGGHSGSEWLHVRILEAKLRLAKDPEWVDKNSVLNIQFASYGDPSEFHTVDHLGQRRSLEDIQKALVYQLHERLEFVKPPEPVVADLLADLSFAFAITRSREDSKAVYELAKTFGTSGPAFPTQPAFAVDEQIEGWSLPSTILAVFTILAALLALGFGIRFIFNQKRHGSVI